MKLALQKCGYAAIVAAVFAAFVLGTTASGVAKEKKKEEPAASRPLTCLFSSSSPVCGDKGGERFTYSNTCWAEKDGAKVVSSKACPEQKAKQSNAKPAKKKS